MRKSLFTEPAGKPTMAGALARIGDDGGLHPVGGDTMSLSTPIASVQDGPRMSGVSNIPAHRKAAPFRKGGKRRKALLAKDALRKSKGGDYSNIDLGFRASERRDSLGRWAVEEAAKGYMKARFKHDSAAEYGLPAEHVAKLARKRDAKLAVLKTRHAALGAGAPSLKTFLMNSDLSNADTDLAFKNTEPRGTDGRWIRAAGAAKTQSERNAIRRQSFGDYQAAFTSHKEHSAVLGILDAADTAAKGHATMDHRLGQTMDTASDALKRKRGLIRRALGLEAKNSPVSRETRQALGLPKGYDPRVGADLAFRSTEKRDSDGKWAKGGPTWVPEKGARGPAEAKYLAAKNMLAKAVLSGDEKTVDKYRQKVGKAKVAFDRERAGQPSWAQAIKQSFNAVSDAMGG